MLNLQKRSSLFGTLICLTILLIAAQLAMFAVHYKVSELVDSLASSSISHDLFHAVILVPVLQFIALQLLAYLFSVCWIWFMAVSMRGLFGWSEGKCYGYGILLFFTFFAGIFTLNFYLYPHSFFAIPFHEMPLLTRISPVILAIIASIFLLGTVLAYGNFFAFRRDKNVCYTLVGSVIFLLGISVAVLEIYENISDFSVPARVNSQPDIIIIGIDSLRPDYAKDTKNISEFLRTSTEFSHAYTPLARTFPAWVSMLTAQYPKHHSARMNLADPAPIIANDNLAKRLRAAGYETFYGTDEVRFTDITHEYGFDHLIGPRGGAAEFLIAGLSDFPLTNVLINTSFGRFLYPYHYGNRAADITYEPKNFLHLVRPSLAKRSQKPAFLAIHLCLAHWPFTWARDGQRDDALLSARYEKSVQAVDQQFGELLQILKNAGMLEHSLVVLMSDHGVTLGIPNDRIVAEKNYVGDRKKLKLVTGYKLNSAPSFSLDFKRDYSISTSYGQGTDVLSVKQYHVLMALKGYGVHMPVQRNSTQTSLLDIAPTLLDLLHLPALPKADGVTLLQKKSAPRAFYMETGDKVAEIETDTISVEKVVAKMIGVYRIDSATGLLRMDPAYEKLALQNKQFAVMQGDWLLAYYPSHLQSATVREGKKVRIKTKKMPSYYVLVNLKTGKWSMTTSAPKHELAGKLRGFYWREIL